MKKIVMIVICMILACSSVFSVASSGKIIALKNKSNMIQPLMSESKIENSDLQIKKDYIANVVPILVGISDDLFISSIGNKEITNAELSNPMPIFASKEKYASGEDFYGKLQVHAWMYIVYSNGTPIATFTSDSNERINSAKSIHGQNFAESMNNALNRIEKSGAVVIPAEGYFLLQMKMIM